MRSPNGSSGNVAFAGIIVCIACGQQEKAPPPLREFPRDASEPVPMFDAPIDRGLGKYDSIKARFEADCPRGLPEDIGAVPSLNIIRGARSCRRPSAEAGRKDVVRYVELIYAPDGGTSYDYIGAPISRVSVAYFGVEGKPMPKSCDRAIGELVEYLRDLTGASEQQGRRVAELMRRQAEAIPRIRLMDREICLWTGESFKGNECGVDVATCDLAPPWDIVDVDLATVEVPSVVSPVLADPAP
jgi:hypothetical protein